MFKADIELKHWKYFLEGVFAKTMTIFWVSLLSLPNQGGQNLWGKKESIREQASHNQSFVDNGKLSLFSAGTILPQSSSQVFLTLEWWTQIFLKVAHEPTN